MGPKELIIQAALDIIGQEGVQKITTREIAKRAKVNSAALNYHFGTKENLIRQAMDFFINKLSGAFVLLESDVLQPGDRLLAFLRTFSEISSMYPGVTKSLVNQMMFAEQDDPVLAAAQKKGVAAFAATLGEAIGTGDQRLLSQLSLQMMAAAIYPILLSRQLPDFYGIDYSDKRSREAYIESLFRMYISD